MRATFRRILSALLLAGSLAVTAAPAIAHAVSPAHDGTMDAPMMARGATRGAMRTNGTADDRRRALGVKKSVPQTAASSSTLQDARTRMLDLINAERARAGAAPLSIDGVLDGVAQARSQDMIDRRYFSHHIPAGPTGPAGMVFDILDRSHIQYAMAGENIALNNYINFYALTRTVEQTNTDLMNSPEHRANLLEPKYARIGIGMAFEQGTGKLIVTEVFVQP
jgi:uncharacterized protein YkwD